MENFFHNTTALGVSLLVCIYFTKFNALSETELVRWSYVWLPVIIFGVVGIFAMKNGKAAGLDDPFKAALITSGKWTIIAMAILIIFYETLWQEL